MNKSVVERQIPLAYKALEESGIVRGKDGYKLVSKGYRGQISAFGASVTMGSLVPAIAFFSKERDGKTSEEDVDRTKLMKAVFLLLRHDAANYGNTEQKNRVTNASNLMQYVCSSIGTGEMDQEQRRKALNNCKEEIENAAIALKLAIGMYLNEVPNKSNEEGDNES